MPTSYPCAIHQCEFQSQPDTAIYSLQTNIVFNSDEIVILVPCLEGYYWPPGSCPQIVRYPPGTFVIPVPPVLPGFPIVIQLMGCQSLVSITLPAGSSAAAITAAANSVIAAVAAQQAICDVVTPPVDPPGDGPPPIIPPNPLPQFFNREVYYACATGSVISFTGSRPFWVSIDTVNNRLFVPVGIFGAPSQTEANFNAQNTLNQFAEDAILLGQFVCTCFTTGATLPAGTVGVAYSTTIDEASPGAGTFSLSSGTLPAGLTLNTSTGVISGTPTVSGVSIFIITFTPT